MELLNEPRLEWNPNFVFRKVPFCKIQLKALLSKAYSNFVAYDNHLSLCELASWQSLPVIHIANSTKPKVSPREAPS